MTDWLRPDAIREAFQLDPSDRPTEFTNSGMQKMFSRLGFDDHCSELLLHVLQNANGLVEFERLSGFLEALLSGDQYAFCEYLYEAMDTDHDQAIDMANLRDFARLMNDPLTDEELEGLIQAIGPDADGKVTFDDFWNRYKAEHALTPDDVGSPV
jgi:Ca2+-binding EF-hand superfamily protein